jgi:prepilin-type N-terminal cleavage/methylation domain-containing protein
MRYCKNSHGFTITELVISLTVAGILAMVLVYGHILLLCQCRAIRDRNNLSVRVTVYSYAANGRYPPCRFNRQH